jgi:D-alanine-D-alanine ligase
MSAQRKTTVGVVFGGRSVEHDVSIVTASQIMRAFNPERYEVVPIYISREGRWVTGAPLLEIKNYQNEVITHSGVEDVLLSPSTQHHGLIINPLAGRFSKSEVKRIDVLFPAVHGTHGEDGTLQGLFELADIPYVGCGVMASAVANNKITAKTILQQHGIPVVESVNFTRTQWQNDSVAITDEISAKLTYPVFVKPATTGSSIGIARANDIDTLRNAIEVAIHFDSRILVESAVTDSMEINCAVLGNAQGELQASILEHPISWNEFLTYEEKYLGGSEGMKSAERIIPAPISAELTQHIQEIAVRAFRAIEGNGTTRIDFLLKRETEQVYLNEFNTLPGSLAFYLWEAGGMPMSELVDKLVQLAREAHADKRRNTYDYRTELLNLASIRGAKGAKGSKGPRA